MSDKSRESSKRRVSSRPFARDVLARAQEVAAQYQVIVSQEEGEYYGRGLELPTVFGDGRTPTECIDNTREALVGAVAYMLEAGKRPPAPAREGKRINQVNVRLTAEEKVTLEATARRKGFSGLSDFIRTAALEASTR
jgi:predicted RNase H-like HicB family nuclease